MKVNKKAYYGSALIVLCVISLILFMPNQDGIVAETFKKLNKLKQEKKEDILNYFEELKEKAISVKSDEILTSVFMKYASSKENVNVNEEMELDKHFVENYNKFYDILFVNPEGLIFHSIKKEADYKKNIFTDSTLNDSFTNFKENPDKVNFIEYHYYKPSDEPAFFIIVPISKSDIFAGWMVFQCPINTVNAVLTDRKELGRTGEIYLLNKNKVMLSDSRFISDCTILKLEVDTKAAKLALKYNSGEGIISDYRNVNVYSSYEKFTALGSTWIIIAEIDEHEVLTEFYRNHKDLLIEKMKSNQYVTRIKGEDNKYLAHSKQKVDMNEYAKSGPEELLFTYGVSTCTSISVIDPSGFSYLAHISPQDRIYNDETIFRKFADFILGNDNYDFLGQILYRIKHYDLIPNDMRRLEFSIIANHCSSLENTIDIILESGFELSNIKFLNNPNAINSNVYVHANTTTVLVEWHEPNNTTIALSERTRNLSNIMKEIINYDDLVLKYKEQSSKNYHS